MANRLKVEDVNIYYGAFKAVEGVTLTFEPRSVTAFIGPSGCGKSTVLRTLNRMHEVIPGGRVEGSITLAGQDLYAAEVDPVAVRRTVGMVFQRPNPFPTMTIFDNVVAGLRLNGLRNKSELADAAERSLRGANHWNEVKDRLNKPGAGLSGGQQQRLCIARRLLALRWRCSLRLWCRWSRRRTSLRRSRRPRRPFGLYRARLRLLRHSFRARRLRIRVRLRRALAARLFARGLRRLLRTPPL